MLDAQLPAFLLVILHESVMVMDHIVDQDCLWEDDWLGRHFLVNGGWGSRDDLNLILFLSGLLSSHLCELEASNGKEVSNKDNNHEYLQKSQKSVELGGSDVATLGMLFEELLGINLIVLVLVHLLSELLGDRGFPWKAIDDFGLTLTFILFLLLRGCLKVDEGNLSSGWSLHGHILRILMPFLDLSHLVFNI